jgi:hypothetical protein
VTHHVKFYERRDDGRRTLLKTVEVPGDGSLATVLSWAAATLDASDPDSRARVVEVRVSLVEVAARAPVIATSAP